MIIRVQSLEIPALRKLLDSKALAVCLFAQERLEFDETAEISSKLLYISYIDWALGQIPKQPVISNISFGRLLLNTIGLVPISTRREGQNARIWRGVKILKVGNDSIQS